MTDSWAMRRSGELKITSIKGWAYPSFQHVTQHTM